MYAKYVKKKNPISKKMTQKINKITSKNHKNPKIKDYFFSNFSKLSL